MKIITRAVIDWETMEVLEEDSYEYTGPVAQCKDSGSAPQPVDPWVQAAAQYGLSTGTASYNAGLNRTNQVNPLGSSSWASTGGGSPAPAAPTVPAATPGAPTGATTPATSYRMINGSVWPETASNSQYGVPVSAPGDQSSSVNPYGIGAEGGPAFSFGGAPPIYTETTQLAPQFQSALERPIDTSGIAGMPGGPSTTQDLQNTQDALYKSQMQYLQPEQDLAKEQLDSRLANEGATIGSAAYNNEQDRLAREQEASRSNARTQAITGAGQEQSRLFGLGSQSLQNQIAVRNAPISEYNSLTGAPGANATALTPDIAGAFGQQYQGALAGYNANVASDNANTSAVGSLALAAAMYF